MCSGKGLFDIYNQIISKFTDMQEKCIPISNIGNDFGFLNVATKEDNEYYRAELIEDHEKITISIWGSDHSGELQYRTDTYHNLIEYMDEQGSCLSMEYMYLAD